MPLNKSLDTDTQQQNAASRLALRSSHLRLLGCSLVALRKQRRLHGAGGYAYARYAFASRALGAAFGLVVVGILCLMVFKP